MNDQYNDAMKWLNVMWNKAYTHEERKTIEYIKKIVNNYHTMRTN